MTDVLLPMPGPVETCGSTRQIGHARRQLALNRSRPAMVSPAAPSPAAVAVSAADYGVYTVPAHRVGEFARLAARHGWKGRAVLSAAGVAAPSLGQPRRGVTADQAAAVLRALWRTTDDKFLGLGLHPVSLDTLRMLAFAVSGATTVGAGLARVEQFMPVLPGLPVLAVSSAGGRTTITFDLAGFDDTVSLVADAALAVTHRIINWGSRRRIQLLQVDVPYQRPRGEIDHAVIFGAPVRFGAPRAAMTFPSSVLNAPVLRRQHEIEKLLANAPMALLSEIDFYSTHTQRVREIIECSLGDHLCSADEIAAGMGISSQTLRRRLREESTSVSVIRDDVLRTAALASVARGGETMAALACRLGFSEPSAFTRAFRRWTGHSPTAFVRQHSAAKGHGQDCCHQPVSACEDMAS